MNSIKIKKEFENMPYENAKELIEQLIKVNKNKNEGHYKSQTYSEIPILVNGKWTKTKIEPITIYERLTIITYQDEYNSEEGENCYSLHPGFQGNCMRFCLYKEWFPYPSKKKIAAERGTEIEILPYWEGIKLIKGIIEKNEKGLNWLSEIIEEKFFNDLGRSKL